MSGPAGPRRRRARRLDPSLRIGTAERERALEELARHFRDGRLTADELTERTLAVHRARTAGDLTPVLGDLPRPTVVGGRPRPGARRRGAIVGALLACGLGLGIASVGGGADSSSGTVAIPVPAEQAVFDLQARITDDAVELLPRAAYAGPVEVDVRNDGSVPHGLRLVGGTGTRMLAPGERATLFVGTLAPGRYELTGTAPGDPQRGLRVTLEVRR